MVLIDDMALSGEIEMGETMHEEFWSFSKNWLYQYRGIPKHHLPLYVKETESRFNNRGKDLFPIIAQLLTGNLAPKSS